jgi:hypothetical protein
MASISFTDDVGSVTLDNGTTAVSDGLGSRFADWTPFQKPIGPATTALGTGMRYQFAFRTDYGASFTMNEIPNTKMDDMLRCQAWLLGGGTVEVDTEDSNNNVYDTCCLAPGGDVSIALQDKALLLYSMTFVLINVDASPSAMICEY